MSDLLQECCNCTKVGHCSETSAGRILKSYTCPRFEPVDVSEMYARSQMFTVYGPVPATRALLKRPDDPNQELARMSIELPAQGTTYSERKKQLEIMSFMDVRVLGNKKYLDQNKNPILDWNDTLTSDKRESSIQRVLAYELANNIIVPDVESSQPVQQGAPAMAQSPYQPPQMMPPQQPMPAAPPPPPGMPQAPYGMAPAPQPGAPMPPPNFAPPPPPPNFAPPPIASPTQAAQVAQEVPQAAQTGGKKKRGAAAAPPPPPPPPNPMQAGAPPQPQQFMQPPGFAPQQPPQMAPQPTQFAPPAFTANNASAPTPVGFGAPGPVDFTPVIAKIDLVGQALNALGTEEQKSGAQIVALLNELKNLQLVQIACLHHLYISNPATGASAQGKDTVAKFIEHMQQYLPR